MAAAYKRGAVYQSREKHQQEQSRHGENFSYHEFQQQADSRGYDISLGFGVLTIKKVAFSVESFFMFIGVFKATGTRSPFLALMTFPDKLIVTCPSNTII
jgi:hypothetical protein